MIGSARIVKFLVEKGAETIMKTQSCLTNVLLNYMAKSDSSEIKDEIVEYLMEKVDLADTDSNGDGIGHWLASFGMARLIQKLPYEILMCENSQKWNPLHFAVENSHFETCKILLQTAKCLIDMKCHENKGRF